MAGFRKFFHWPALGEKTDPAWVADQQGKGRRGREEGRIEIEHVLF